MKQTIQWFFDIQTSTEGIQFVDIRAGGEHIRMRLSGFFSMYRYFKLGSVHVKLVPASTLPVDPTGLSLETGENTVDPRDQLNPGMFRITNGEALDLDLTGMSIDEQFKLYEALVNDPRWFNFMLQKGVSRSAIPLYWNVGQFQQDIYPGTVFNYPTYNNTGRVIETANCHLYNGDGVSTGFKNVHGTFSDPRGFFQTGRAPMGWLPTTCFMNGGFNVKDTVNSVDQGVFTPIPDVNVMTLVLPPAHKTKYYYRCFVSETVYFKEMIQANAGLTTGFGITTSAGIDNFQVTSTLPGVLGSSADSWNPSTMITPPNNGAGSGGGPL